MYTHIREEIPSVLKQHGLPLVRYLHWNLGIELIIMKDFSRESIFGHSMGGHGALTMYLKNIDSPRPYLSASAFAPITNPTKAPWGEKAFKGYLRGGIEEGRAHDATELIAKIKSRVNIFIDYVRVQHPV